MMRWMGFIAVLLACAFVAGNAMAANGDEFLNEPPEAKAQRMQWWNEARFGMFIHWGLYAVPAGVWEGKTNYGEWIRDQAKIPVQEYGQLIHRFNPVRFDAGAWVRMAKEAGMKYIVITSKHHDGFCLFDSQETEFDVLQTPFRRDILKELSEACAAGGITLCFYHSIMDWNNPDYLPRRGWEKKNRPEDGANLENYVGYMKKQLKELTTNYGKIGVLWFDGEWEKTWNHDRGIDLYKYVRGLQPGIIVNNRVDVGRQGMAGMSDQANVGDFGTPEQEIPATGMPAGTYWETCMTMNDHWGYNQRDKKFKDTKDLVRKLVDIASKGGNFLLNVGPMATGEFPPESVRRLSEIGRWMKVNGDSIYGTTANPFAETPWGRCTVKKTANGGTTLYLHIFDWPADSKVTLPVEADPSKAWMLSMPDSPVSCKREDGKLVVTLPEIVHDRFDTVLALEFPGDPKLK